MATAACAASPRSMAARMASWASSAFSRADRSRDVCRRLSRSSSAIGSNRAVSTGLLAAASNPVLTALFDPIALLLRDSRRQTSGDRLARDNALLAHEGILAAIERGDAAQAGAAMREHLARTGQDLAVGRGAPGRSRRQRRAG